MEAPEIIEKLKAAEATQEHLAALLKVNEDLILGYHRNLRYEIESKINEWGIAEGVNVLDFKIYSVVVVMKNGVIVKISITKPKLIW